MYILCHSDLYAEQLISLHPFATYIAKRYISAVRYTNVNGIVLLEFPTIDIDRLFMIPEVSRRLLMRAGAAVDLDPGHHHHLDLGVRAPLHPLHL